MRSGIRLTDGAGRLRENKILILNGTRFEKINLM